MSVCSRHYNITNRRQFVATLSQTSIKVPPSVHFTINKIIKASFNLFNG